MLTGTYDIDGGYTPPEGATTVAEALNNSLDKEDTANGLDIPKQAVVEVEEEAQHETDNYNI